MPSCSNAAMSKVDHRRRVPAANPAPYRDGGKTSRPWTARSPACTCSASTSRRIRTWEQVQAEYETVWRLARGASARKPDRSAADDRSGIAGRHAVALDPDWPRLLYRSRTVFWLVCRMVNISLAARRMRGVGARLLPISEASSAPPFTVREGYRFVQARMRPGRRRTASSPTRRRFTTRWASLRLDATDRDRDRLQPRGHSHGDRDRAI